MKKAGYLKQTASTLQKKGLRLSLGETENQKWSEKYDKFEKKCMLSSHNNKQLNGGLKVFEDYCEFIDLKLT